MSAGERPQVVVVGAGFGGLAVVRGLADAPVDVTIVDRNNFHTFLPLLYQVATAGLNAADVSYPVRGVFQRQANAEFRRAEVRGADLEAGLLRIADDRDLAFDHLVLAPGSRTNYFDVPGAAANAFPLYSLRDAARLRNHVLERFETAAAAGAVGPGGLTFAVVGGGPTGVEMAGALAELFDQVLRHDHKRLDVSRARIVLIEREDRLLPPFSERSQRFAQRTLRERGIDLRLETTVVEVAADVVRLDPGGDLPCRTLIWAAGVAASPLPVRLGLETGPGGRAVVGSDLSVPGHPGVWVIGDAAVITDGSRHLPQLAPVAIQSGEHVARQIVARVDGRPSTPFQYHDRGIMATIGRRAAVAELANGTQLTGSLAWLAWLGLHLVFLVGVRNRLSVLLNWAYSYLTWDRGPRLIFSLEDRTQDRST